jgi:hypothetical protein
MARGRMKPQRDGWATAQQPRLIAGMQLPEESVAPAQRQREAERLRADIEAHIAAGGTYVQLTSPAPRRRGRA